MHLMRWRIGLGEDRGLAGSQVESETAWLLLGQTITWTTDEANLFTRSIRMRRFGPTPTHGGFSVHPLGGYRPTPGL